MTRIDSIIIKAQLLNDTLSHSTDTCIAGNYEEGFGKERHKNKWNGLNSKASPETISSVTKSANLADLSAETTNETSVGVKDVEAVSKEQGNSPLQATTSYASFDLLDYALYD